MSGIECTGSVDGIPEPPGPFKWTVGCNGLVFVSGVRGFRPDTDQMAVGDNLTTRTFVEVTGLNQSDSIKIEIIAAQTEPQ